VEQVEALGGSAAAIEMGFFQDEIGRSAYEHQLRIEAGESVVVGVNKFSDGQDPPVIPAPDFSRLERGQVEQLTRVKATRDTLRATRALAALASAAQTYMATDASRTPLMPLIIDAVRARASVGEISDTLSRVWGTYRPG
jgi:methylmalonyl-CoA mutase, N-terminal domain